jgi:hypothetical protein
MMKYCFKKATDFNSLLPKNKIKGVEMNQRVNYIKVL